MSPSPGFPGLPVPSDPSPTRSFDWDQQHAFARLSGDANPLHLDPVWTRRTQMGRPVVHGLHMLAWALDTALLAPDLPNVGVITARFIKPVFVNETVTLKCVSRTTADLKIAVLVDDLVVMQATLSLRHRPTPAGSAAEVSHTPPNAPPDPQSEPAKLGLADIENRTGAVCLPDFQAVTEAFPGLVAAWGAARVATLIATSRLIGMDCPGLHSLYLGLRLALCPDDRTQHTLGYAVTGVERRFRTVDLQITGPGLEGTLNALARRPPVAQPSMAELREALPAMVPAERQRQALIIGGSRGLGALTARLVAICGGKPIITYAVGRAEAEEVAADIGGPDACKIMAYDVRQPAAKQLAGLEALPDEVYYFATGPVFRRASGRFSPLYFTEFVQFYVIGFSALVSALRDRGARDLKIFYPSTIALSEPAKDLAEYTAAKAAGEQLCHHLNRFSPQVRVLVQRLPRLLTDQTATATAVDTADAVAVLSPIIQAMQKLGLE